MLLYGLESKKPLSEFDVIAFSLQYELSYPTLLSMLELGGIPYKNEERNDSHPIVIAGGPGSYNPEPVADFIDAFIIGDGETVIIEIMETVQSAKKSRLTRLETLKKLADLRGVYVPVVYDGTKMVEKRIEDIDNTDYPVDFPVPFSSAVHDRAVIEIRRGCGRMCRFCQPCFVNFPVRERSPQNIIRLTDEFLKNT